MIWKLTIDIKSSKVDQTETNYKKINTPFKGFRENIEDTKYTMHPSETGDLLIY